MEILPTIGQLEELSTTVGTSDNWRCSRELLVVQTNRGASITAGRYSGQLEVLSMTRDPMMLYEL